MIITGMTGGIGHGKTTFSNLLAKQANIATHFETWELVAEVATALRHERPVHPSADDMTAINQWLAPLPEIVSQHTHTAVSFEDIQLTPEKQADQPVHFEKLYEYLRAVADEPTLATADITTENKQAFRPLLQWLGGYMVVVGGSGIWYDEIVRRIAVLRGTACELVTVGGVRYPGDAERLRNAGGVIIEIQRPDLPSQDIADLTERDRQLIEPDCKVTNNGTLEQLETCAKQVYKDLSLRQLQKTYAAQPSTARV